MSTQPIHLGRQSGVSAVNEQFVSTQCIMMRTKRRIYIYIFSACLLILTHYFFGLGDYLSAKNFEEFNYPLNIDIKPLVQQVLAGEQSFVEPINYYPYRFISNSGICKTVDKLDLFIAVKSAMENFQHREAIRKTYGRENSVPGAIIKLLFFLGISESPENDIQKKINEEMALYKDIIQIDFRDNYYNNTIKTMMSFRWVYEHCSTADYYLFTDDDMYISVYNLLDYVRYKTKDRSKYLFAGYVFNSAPIRFPSKWRVSVEEYPWNRWPPYVTAGAYVVSNQSMKVIYIGSLFVKHFKFDDIYLGIVAKKVGIVPTHCDQFHFYKKSYSKEGYKDVIASHGYDDHDEMIRVWNEQNSFTIT